MLVQRKFKTKIEKKEFLKGTFVTNGVIDKDEFSFRFANSLSKYKLMKSFLKYLGQDIMEVKNIEAIPYIIEISFKPSNRFDEEFRDLKYNIDK